MHSRPHIFDETFCIKVFSVDFGGNVVQEVHVHCVELRDLLSTVLRLMRVRKKKKVDKILVLCKSISSLSARFSLILQSFQVRD